MVRTKSTTYAVVHLFACRSSLIIDGFKFEGKCYAYKARLTWLSISHTLAPWHFNSTPLFSHEAFDFQKLVLLKKDNN